MFVGKDINISSESFISTEQLFSVSDTNNHGNSSSNSSSSSSSNSNKNKPPTTTPSHRTHRPSLITKSGLRPPHLLISTTAVTTATNMSNGNGPSLSWR
jgi:hypothetical protein